MPRHSSRNVCSLDVGAIALSSRARWSVSSICRSRFQTRSSRRDIASSAFCVLVSFPSGASVLVILPNGVSMLVFLLNGASVFVFLSNGFLCCFMWRSDHFVRLTCIFVVRRHFVSLQRRGLHVFFLTVSHSFVYCKMKKYVNDLFMIYHPTGPLFQYTFIRSHKVLSRSRVKTYHVLVYVVFSFEFVTDG